jgi:hypothetical protein
MRRVVRYDGLLPAKLNEAGSFAELTPADIRAMKAFVEEHRAQPTPFDIVMEGETPGDDPEKAADIIRPWAKAGVTWWIETRWQAPRNTEGRQAAYQRILQGPPRLEA